MVRRGSSPSALGSWLIQSAKGGRITREIFDSEVNWRELTPLDLYIMRSCAPNGVFAEEKRDAYLSRVAGNPSLSEIAYMLFADDVTFAEALPDDCRAEMKALMTIAHQKRVRRTDPRIMQ